MTFTVEYTHRAERDLREITAWYLEESGSIDIASDWSDGIYSLIEDLSHTADRHPPACELEVVEGDLREVHYGSGRRTTHRIIYQIIGERVVILRIRHTSQRELTPDDIR